MRDTVVFLLVCKSVNKEKIRVNQKSLFRKCTEKTNGITKNEHVRRRTRERERGELKTAEKQSKDMHFYCIIGACLRSSAAIIEWVWVCVHTAVATVTHKVYMHFCDFYLCDILFPKLLLKKYL